MHLKQYINLSGHLSHKETFQLMSLCNVPTNNFHLKENNFIYHHGIAFIFTNGPRDSTGHQL